MYLIGHPKHTHTDVFYSNRYLLSKDLSDYDKYHMRMELFNFVKFLCNMNYFNIIEKASKI